MLDVFMNSPWEEYPEIFKSKSQFFSWLRGGIRRSLWNNSQIKLDFIKRNRIRIPNPNPKGKVAEVWGAKCGICSGLFPLKDIQVDHVSGNHSLKEIEDITPFILAISCPPRDGLMTVCKSCHAIKSKQEKDGTTFEHAKAEKQAIQIIKEKNDLIWLQERGIVPASNQKKRREQIVEYLLRVEDD